MKSSVPKILWGMILAYILVFGIFTAIRHYQFQTQAWDMGIFDQLFWNTTHGQFMQSSLEEIPDHFGIHFSPTLLLLVPGYALFPSPYYLLLIQTFALALGAWPLYLIARKKLGDPLPLIIAGAYLLYPSLHWVNTFDFHEIAFFVPLALSGFYFLEEKKWLPASIFLTLAAGTKEDAILMVFFIGLYTFIKAFLQKDKSQKIAGISVILIALIYFLVTIKIIMPSFGGGLLRLDRYQELGTSVSEMIGNSIANPSLPISILFQTEKLRYVFWLFLPAAFLPLFSLSSLILILPGILENTLTNFPTQFSGNYQYDAILLPGIFLGSIFGISYLLKYRPDKKELLKNILIFTIAAGFFLRSPVNPVFFPVEIFKSDEKIENFSALISNIPSNASVSANTNLVPHLSQRSKIYVLGSEPEPVDIILADGADLFGFLNQEDFESYLNSYLDSGFYELDVYENRYIKITRKNLIKR